MRSNGANAVVIRVADVLLSVAALAVLFVPMAVVALLIRAEDRGPAFFRQIRVGRDGRQFQILKFRSMKHDPSRGTGGVFDATDLSAMREARARFRTTDPIADPRITRMGKLLRASHLDELPQFFNVVVGHMSVVGVRPDTPVQEVDYPAEYWRVRHKLRPGITGPAQLKSDTATMEERSVLELSWIERPTLEHYLQLLLATVGKILKRTGN